MRRAAIALVAAALMSAAHAATPVKIIKRWTGHMPAAVAPLLQSSAASQDEWSRVWATCLMKGAAPAIDFDKHLVLVAVRRSSAVTFNDLKLDNGNLTTSVAASPDMPNHMTCALALVPRAGVTKVNGAPPGK
jgi:hypothetical protein